MTQKKPVAEASGKLDLNAVWSRGTALLLENSQLIAILAGVFVFLPTAGLQFTLPADAQIEGPMTALLDMESSEATKEKAAQTLGELLAPFLTLSGLSLVVNHVGYAAIVALIGRARPTVGQALAQAFRVIFPLLLALLIAALAIYAVLIALQVVLSPLGPAVAIFLGSIVGLLFAFFVTARLFLTLPVMVLEWRLNPLKALARSWRLTAQSASNVFGFWMLMAVAWFVSLLFEIVLSTGLASIPGPGSIAFLIDGLLGGVFAMVWGSIYCAMGVAMHAQLKGPDAGDIAAKFE
ncbi:MAG: hypothetical protein QNI87_10530 [Erythrobacter sp.]|uniref:hypothetical protein n=1 Tax=Erythrobacter sp. TaxID=1042 RepID=UPI002633DAEF|nr:hypothetical protein [Erythrobacter sp.]MDJ0978961.1 hypothetical protein [Erythrobacter sp.]